MDFTIVENALALSKNEDELERVYDKVRIWIWEKIRTPQPLPETKERLDFVGRVLTQIELKEINSEEDAAPECRFLLSHFASRMETLADLLNDTLYFEMQHSLADLLNREHVLTILTVLTKNAGKLSRNNLIQAVKLSDANLSRILRIIESGGLVIRESKGREVIVRLTPAGRMATEMDVSAAETSGAVGAHEEKAEAVQVSSHPRRPHRSGSRKDQPSRILGENPDRPFRHQSLLRVKPAIPGMENEFAEDCRVPA